MEDEYHEKIICPHCGFTEHKFAEEIQCDGCNKLFKVEEFNGLFSTEKMEDK